MRPNHYGIVGISVAFLLCANATPLRGVMRDEDLTEAIWTAYRNALPSVVRVDATARNDDGSVIARRSSGSGVLIAEDGVVVTSLEVIRAGQPAKALLAQRDSYQTTPVNIIVTLSEGKKYDAQLIGCDALSKLALLKIAAETVALPFAPASDLRNGIVTLGFAGGSIRDAPTLGQLGEKRTARPVGESGCTIMRTVSNPIVNSGVGGPMIDLRGRLVGIVAGAGHDKDMDGAVESAFIVPAGTVAWVAGALRRDGAVRRGYLGIALKTGTLVVDTIDPGSPAEGAGLSNGDRIVAADFLIDGGKLRTVEFANEDGLTFRQTISRCAPGSTVNLHVQRAGVRLPPISVEMAESGVCRPREAHTPR